MFWDLFSCDPGRIPHKLLQTPNIERLGPMGVQVVKLMPAMGGLLGLLAPEAMNPAYYLTTLNCPDVRLGPDLPEPLANTMLGSKTGVGMSRGSVNLEGCTTVKADILGFGNFSFLFQSSSRSCYIRRSRFLNRWCCVRNCFFMPVTFSPTAKLAMGSLAQKSSGAIRCSCNTRFRRRFRRVPEPSGADCWWGSGGFRYVPVQMADEVPDSSGAAGWWSSGGFRCR